MVVWKPPSGQTALIEPIDDAHTCLTGVVVEDDGGGADVVVVDLGASPPLATPDCEVTASFFSPEALYRAAATCARHNGGDSVVDLTIHRMERIQRRSSPRAQVRMPVVLSNFDDPDPDAGGSVFASVTGESIDVAEGGCRVVTDRQFPHGCDPTVTLHLSDTEELVALAAVLEEQDRPDGRHEYRLVFIDPDDDHRERLAKLVAAAA
jgi:hypothetical protein